MKLTKPVRDIRTISALMKGAEAEAHNAGDSVPGVF